MDLKKLQKYVEVKKLLDEKDWWTINELAVYLDKKPDTIRNYTCGKSPKLDISKCSKVINGTVYIMKDLFKEQFLKTNN